MKYKDVIKAINIDEDLRQTYMSELFAAFFEFDNDSVYNDLEFVNATDNVPSVFEELKDIPSENSVYIILKIQHYNELLNKVEPVYYWKWKLNNVDKYDNSKLSQIVFINLDDFDLIEVIKKSI